MVHLRALRAGIGLPVLFAFLALLMIITTVIVAFWDTNRLLAVGLVAANIFAVAVWIKRKDPKEHIALGPFLLLGFYLAAFMTSWRILTAVGESLT